MTGKLTEHRISTIKLGNALVANALSGVLLPLAEVGIEKHVLISIMLDAVATENAAMIMAVRKDISDADITSLVNSSLDVFTKSLHHYIKEMQQIATEENDDYET